MADQTVAPGQTVELKDGRIALVRFFGTTLFADGNWVGVELDDASGKNDGSVKGVRYFDCAENRGMFLRITGISRVIDEPARAPDDVLDEDDDEEDVVDDDEVVGEEEEEEEEEGMELEVEPEAAPVAAVRANNRPSMAGARQAVRPSSLHTLGTSRSGSDPNLGRRMSLNAPSPSPVSRTARSGIRSPSKPPPVPSLPTSRTTTPSNSRPPATRSRPSIGGSSSRGSMPPPPAPSAKPRQASISSTSGARPGGPATRTGTSRLSISTTKAPPAVRSAPAASTRRTPSDVAPGRLLAGAAQSSGDVAGSPGEAGILSPQPHSPAVARTSALERMAAASTTGSARGAAGATAGSSRLGGASGDTERLNTKAQTLERQNAEQREKIKELEKSKVERDRFEGIIHKLQTKYQPLQHENVELKKLLEEAEKRLESVEQMQADLEDEYRDQLELATVEREMAEVQAENYKLELDTLKSKAEELELEADLLKEENVELSKGMSMEEKESTGWMQMQKHNERLKEALLKLHDLSRDNEEELRQQIATLEEDLKDYSAIKQEYEVTKESLQKAEMVKEDLRQQLDVAIGAEDMIEDLSERNGALQEELQERNAIIQDLESLREINDDLEHNYVQNARELQEELDFKESLINEQARRAARQEEALIDMANTLVRFREMVANQQAELEASQANNAVTASESEKLRDRSRAMEDLNKKLRDTVTNAQNKTIELELRRLDVQVAQKELDIVRRFLPDTYADERDSVAVLLSFRRIAFKANMLRDLMRKRITEQTQPTHEDEVFDGCDAIDNLTTIAVLSERLTNSASHCSVDEFARYKKALESVEPVNRNLDRLIDALRRDELKEKTCAADARRLVDVVAHLAVDCIEGQEASEVEGEDEDQKKEGEGEAEGELASSADEVVARTVIMHSQLDSAALSLNKMRSMVQRVLADETKEEADVVKEEGDGDKDVEEGDGEGESVEVSALEDSAVKQTSSEEVEEQRLAQQFTSRVEAASYQTRVAKVAVGKMVRSLEEYQQRALALKRDFDPRRRFNVAASMAGELASAAREAGLGLHEMLHEAGRTRPYTYAEIQDQIEFLTAYTKKAHELTAEAARLAELCSELGNFQEFTRGAAPWELRSQQARLLQLVPEKTEQELRQARDALRDAQKRAREEKEASEIAALRIAHLQSRMADEKEVAKQMEEYKAQIASMTTQNVGLKEDRQKQDKELQTLEADRDKWKKIAGDSRAFADGIDAADLRAGQERAAAAAAHMDALRDDISGLESAVRHLREDNRRARTTEQASYDWLAEPLRSTPTPATERRKILAAESRDALSELVRMATSSTAGVFDLATLPEDKLAWRPARTTPRHHAAKQAEEYAAWKSWQASVLRKSKALLDQERHVTAAAQRRTRTTKNAAREAREAVARLQIRLPGVDGGKETRGEVHVFGSREWEALQGRVVG